jgi:putative FmdB family regulatory protein
MPTYEYFCQDCENKFEVKASLAEKEKGLKVKCPACEGKNTVQILGNFFSFSKGKRQNSGGCCGPSTSSGCCGF